MCFYKSIFFHFFFPFLHPLGRSFTWEDGLLRKTAPLIGYSALGLRGTKSFRAVATLGATGPFFLFGGKELIFRASCIIIN